MDCDFKLVGNTKCRVIFAKINCAWIHTLDNKKEKNDSLYRVLCIKWLIFELLCEPIKIVFQREHFVFEVAKRQQWESSSPVLFSHFYMCASSFAWFISIAWILYGFMKSNALVEIALRFIVERRCLRCSLLPLLC